MVHIRLTVCYDMIASKIFTSERYLAKNASHDQSIHKARKTGEYMYSQITFPTAQYTRS